MNPFENQGLTDNIIREIYDNDYIKTRLRHTDMDRLEDRDIYTKIFSLITEEVLVSSINVINYKLPACDVAPQLIIHPYSEEDSKENTDNAAFGYESIRVQKGESLDIIASSPNLPGAMNTTVLDEDSLLEHCNPDTLLSLFKIIYYYTPVIAEMSVSEIETHIMYELQTPADTPQQNIDPVYRNCLEWTALIPNVFHVLSRLCNTLGIKLPGDIKQNETFITGSNAVISTTVFNMLSIEESLI